MSVYPVGQLKPSFGSDLTGIPEPIRLAYSSSIDMAITFAMIARVVIFVVKFVLSLIVTIKY